ncbi:tight junction protein ZO-3 isoform X3 [Phyllopteryx taeniolatus]|uniref:tight junction protein ZO-3 isoform X3 n=1 Tax=Phyllopteryx taeniolatus TaxID=161469 RepID=UPI002AD487C8|nr:tight junction protein ZO-3 isoform X3 [Phyllopteryx taeniolatus]
MNATQRIKLMKHFGSVPPESPPPLLVVPKPGMEELTIWEQHTITLNKDSKLGFGFALSGGKDKPHLDNGDTAVIVSDVLPNGPAMGRLFNKDQIVMVNGVSMENVHSNFTIQSLKSCGKTANITVKRPRRIQIPATTRPARAASHSNLLDQDPPRRTRRYSDASDNREASRYHVRARSSSPDRNGYGGTLPLMSSGYKRLPRHDDKPLRTTLVKKKISDEYGLKLGSQIFIKHMTETGLAAKEGTLQEGDLILKINGMTTENLSLLETKHLVEKSRGKLTMTVLRDHRKFLVSIPEVEDSAPNSEDERQRRRHSSSEMEDISDLDDRSPHRTSRHPSREKRTPRARAELPPSVLKSRDSSPVRSTLTRPPARGYASRRAPSDSESDRSASPPPARTDSLEHSSKYKSVEQRSLSGLSTLPNPRSSPAVHNWSSSRPASSSSRPHRPVSDSDSDRSASPHRGSPRPDSRYNPRVLPADLSHTGLRASPILVRQEPPRRVNSPLRVPPPGSESESEGSSAPPWRQSATYSQDSYSSNRYRVLPDVSSQPETGRHSASGIPVGGVPHRAPSESDSEASYESVPRRHSTDSAKSDRARNRYRVLPEIKPSSVDVNPKPPRRIALPVQPPSDDSSESDDLSHLRRSGSSDRGGSRRSAPDVAHSSGTMRSGISVRNDPPVSSAAVVAPAKLAEEPIYSLPPDSYPTSHPGYSSNLHEVSFVKEGSVGLRLVGGNDVGIFVGGVQPNSPAYERGMKEGDQILMVNNIDFGHFTREEAANFLLNIKRGEKVDIRTQNKMDIYKKIIKSNLGDNFYIRTHYDHETDHPIGLNFTRGEVFRVVDTMHRGKLGNWLAIRMGNDLHELDKGTIPNQTRAEVLASQEQAQRASGERPVSGPRAEFWKLRGLRGNKKNEKNMRRSRDDLMQLTIQGKFPAYERVLLREANFKRPIVILGPLNDIAMEKLAREMPDEYEVAEMVPRSGGGDSASTVIKLDTVRKIAEKDKHPLLDITPTAVERLNYIQYHPMVIFLDPHSRKDVKVMRQRYSPDSNKSSRRLYSQALKLRKDCSHLFSARVDLQPGSNIWYQVLKDKIRHQQSKPVWVSEVTLDSGGEQDLDALDQTQSDYLSAASDLEDTDGEPFTDGEAYTDNEDLDEAYPGQDAARSSRVSGAALARSSEPAWGHRSPDEERDPEPYADVYSPRREIPPLMHVPEPSILRRQSRSPPLHHPDDEPFHRSFADSDFNHLDADAPTTPSDGPPDFIAPDPSTRYSFTEPSYADEHPESPQQASLSAIEDKLQQVRRAEPQKQAEDKKALQFIVVAHHQAVQVRRTQIRGGSKSSEEDEEDEAEDIEWGPATEL